MAPERRPHLVHPLPEQVSAGKHREVGVGVLADGTVQCPCFRRGRGCGDRNVR